jgi:hypothetical protein
MYVEYFGKTYVLRFSRPTLHVIYLLSRLALMQEPRLGKLHLTYILHLLKGTREGINALDAAVQAYTNISVLRQQIKTDCRVHGMIEGKDWSPNGPWFLLFLISGSLTYSVF